MSRQTVKPLNTTREIDALQVPEGSKSLRQPVKSPAAGLYIYMRSQKRKASKTWVYRYSIAGSRHDMVLGKYPAVSLADARQQHLRAAQLVAEGIDPIMRKAATIAVNKTVLSFQQLIDKWIEDQEAHAVPAGQITQKTVDRHRWRWDKYLAKTLANLRLPDVEEAHLRLALTRTRQSSREECRKAISTLNQALLFAKASGYIKRNPAVEITPGSLTVSQAPPRERALTLDELRLLWQLLSGAEVEKVTLGLSLQVQLALKLIILTGVRRVEVVGMEWSEVDFTDEVWKIPSERSKNRQSHTIYLSSMALQVLAEAKALCGDSRYVFASPRRLDGPMAVDTLSRAVSRICHQLKAVKGQPIKPFTVHDLRRTAATHWNESLDTDSQVVELMLNHKPQNRLTATYQTGKHRDRQRSVWIRWGQFIERLLNDETKGKVVRLQHG